MAAWGRHTWACRERCGWAPAPGWCPDPPARRTPRPHPTSRSSSWSAAAGFGKTTLVSQWLVDDHRSVAWIDGDARNTTIPRSCSPRSSGRSTSSSRSSPAAKQQLATRRARLQQRARPPSGAHGGGAGTPVRARHRRRPASAAPARRGRWSRRSPTACRRIAARADLAHRARPRARPYARRPASAHRRVGEPGVRSRRSRRRCSMRPALTSRARGRPALAPHRGMAGRALPRDARRSRSRTTRSRQPQGSPATTVSSSTTSARSSSRSCPGDRASSCCRRRSSTSSRRRCATRCSTRRLGPAARRKLPVRSSC